MADFEMSFQADLRLLDSSVVTRVIELPSTNTRESQSVWSVTFIYSVVRLTLEELIEHNEVIALSL